MTTELEHAVAHIEKRLAQPGAFRLDDERRIRIILAALSAAPAPAGDLVERVARYVQGGDGWSYDGDSVTSESLEAARAIIALIAAMQPVGETWASISEWQKATFGPVTLDRLAGRANEEMQELLADPSDVSEAADVCIALAGYPGLAEAIDAKMAVNRTRKWVLNGDGTGQHVKPLPAAPGVGG